MCFLKFIPQPPVLASQCSDLLPPAPLSSQLAGKSCFSSLKQPAEMQCGLSSAQLAMFSCLKQLATNSQAIAALQEKLNRSDALLTNTKQLFTDFPAARNASLPSIEHFHEAESTNEEGRQSADPLTVRLFGERSYKYRLVLNDAVPETLYKDRNFGLSFKLVNLSTGALESNGNLVNICLGVCDSNGEWVQETKEGAPFLKGKLEAELYHGQGEFVKLAPRDVSRSFPDKKLTLVVYAKPSLLQYSGESSLERRVEHSLIEPLLVKDISIKAKRRD